MSSVTFNPDEDIPDLSGKVILVTGGNTGLGKETCLQLAKHNPEHLWLAARTASKAEQAISEIKSAVPSARITHLPLDLTSFESISSAVQTFKAGSTRLDILINNAGIMAVPVGVTKEGYEIQLGTNHLGHYLLTKLLLPTLLSTSESQKSSPDVRIINLSSAGHHGAFYKGIDFENHHLKWSGTWARYAQSKLANVLFTKELTKRYPGITSVAVHPGVIKTDLGKQYRESSGSWFKFLESRFAGYVYTDISTGTKNQLWAATVHKEKLENGAYYIPIGKKNPGSRWARDENMAKRLWEWSEEQVKKHGY
ncbi:MAG: hypothetical protein M1823_004346 [Watsoniomyces obsoletus]|nr:MAG: hypothetical protein M1823_004346 [Watsoniomyces obsoletus]